MDIELSNQLKQKPLTSDNVNSGNYLYFLCKPSKDWTFDDDFVLEKLPKLSIVQDAQKFQLLWKENFNEDNPTPSLLVGFTKSLRLNKPFNIEFDYGDGIDTKQIITPMELWPGYTTVTLLWSDADGLTKSQQLKEAVKVYDQLLSNNQLQIFPEYANARKRRIEIFRDLLNQTKSSFTITTSQQVLNSKEKMLQIDGYIPQFQYVVDSLPNSSASITIADSIVYSLITEARESILRATITRDSLLRASDKENVEWFLSGTIPNEKRYTYLTLIPIVTYTLSSIGFTDTAIYELTSSSLPDQYQLDLQKAKLTEFYESFIRVMNQSLKQHIGFFSYDFLLTLRLDTASFSQPYYSMLKSINDFFLGDMNNTRNELMKVFRMCDDTELLSRFIQLRIAVDLHALDVPQEAIRLLRDAAGAEQRNDFQTALELYKQAMIIAPTYAYASYALGSFYVRTNETERALAFFKKAYQLDKMYLPAYRETYSIYNRSGNFKPMIEVLTLAIQNGNDYWETNYNLGYAYQGDGDFVRASQYFERALALNPKSYRTIINCGLAYQNSRNYNKAREFFNRAIELDPDRPEAVSMLKNLDELQRGNR
jgi:tetratricopeptide (TPR) repeat protein